jgi:Methyltransferase domain
MHLASRVMATQWPARARNLVRGNLRLRGLHESNAAVAAYKLQRALFSRLGFQVVLKHFYSPIPDLGALTPETWERRSELAGIAFDLEQQVEFLEHLEPHLREFDPPLRQAGQHEYRIENPSYGPADAAVLYALTRHYRPSRIVELGSGFTTLVLAQAIRENGSGELLVFDPHPGIAGPDTPGVTSFHDLAAQSVPLETFEKLAAGDFLVVDTTHTVKIGGDVNRIVLDVLPRLAVGVIVHFHDIFLPYEYPRLWFERFALYWTEQYLLQAFLALNPAYEVLCALHPLMREYPDRVRSLGPGIAHGGAPAAFWIRRTR